MIPSLIIVHFLSFQLLRVAAAPKETPQTFELHLPKKSDIKPPTGMTLKYVALGSGTQNYICQKDPAGNTASWAPHGADATLYDISKDSSKATRLATDLMVGSKDKRARPNLKSYPAFGKHSFVPNNGKPAPRFQIYSDVIIVKKTQQASSPKNPQRNVDWLQLETVGGNFAKRVYRTSTRGGKAPAAKCQSLNEIINQPYAAIYSFWA